MTKIGHASYSVVMGSDRIRIVLDSSVKMSEAGRISSKHNWWVSNVIRRVGEEPAETIYVTQDDRTFIHWIDDPKLGVSYILVEGAAAPEVAQVLRDGLTHWPAATIAKRARKPGLSASDRRIALYHLALDKMDHDFDQDTFDIYAIAMRDPDPIVRGSAVLGSAYLGWPQLAEPLRPLATTAEPDDSIRNDAATLLERLAQLASPSQL